MAILAERAMEAALHVAARLRDPSGAEQAASAAASQTAFPGFSYWLPHSLAQGNAGLVVLWAYLDLCFPNRGWDLVGKTHLELAARGAEQNSMGGTGMASGIAGLAFAAWQLSREGTRYLRLLTSLDDTMAHETIPIAARVRAGYGVPVGEFDAIAGLSGIGAYLLKRYREPAASVALANTVDALITMTTREGPLPAWHTPAQLLFDDEARKNYPHGNLNCGLAHGIPGVLAFLSLFRLADIRLPNISMECLDQAIVTAGDWLCANRMEDAWGMSWPSAIPLELADGGSGTLCPGDPRVAPGGASRTAWCYGAPGIARAIWLAGQALDRSDYRDLATSAMESVYRRPIAARMIDSPTFCHGVAGLLAITLRFAGETRMPLFVEQAEKLTEQILGSYQPESLLGFRNVEWSNNQTDQPGLLDGAAGVSLVLAAAATGTESTWDRAFLLA
jgi:lantibiotic biosynthesis protein